MQSGCRIFPMLVLLIGAPASSALALDETGQSPPPHVAPSIVPENLAETTLAGIARLEPTVIDCERGEWLITNIHIDPDEPVIYALAYERELNLSALLWFYRLELTIGCLVIAALVLARKLYKTARLGRTPGEPYCRKCNYRLTGSDSAKCPECGCKLTGRNRVIAKPALAKLALLSFLLLASANTAGWLLYHRLSQTGAIGGLFAADVDVITESDGPWDFYSARLYQFAKMLNLRIIGTAYEYPQTLSATAHLVTLDLDTGDFITKTKLSNDRWSASIVDYTDGGLAYSWANDIGDDLIVYFHTELIQYDKAAEHAQAIARSAHYVGVTFRAFPLRQDREIAVIHDEGITIWDRPTGKRLLFHELDWRRLIPSDNSTMWANRFDHDINTISVFSSRAAAEQSIHICGKAIGGKGLTHDLGGAILHLSPDDESDAGDREPLDFFDFGVHPHPSDRPMAFPMRGVEFEPISVSSTDRSSLPAAAIGPTYFLNLPAPLIDDVDAGRINDDLMIVAEPLAKSATRHLFLYDLTQGRLTGELQYSGDVDADVAYHQDRHLLIIRTERTPGGSAPQLRIFDLNRIAPGKAAGTQQSDTKDPSSK